MDDFDTLLLILIIVSELALIAAILGGIGWYLYRKASGAAKDAQWEKAYLEERREAYLVFIGEQTRILNSFSRKKTDEGFLDLARRFLHEERKHAEAAKDRDSMIWDLRMESTMKLIELFRDIRGVPQHRAQDAGEEALPDSEKQKALEQSKLIHQQREEIKELTRFREAWVRLHRYAMRESVASSRLRAALQGMSTDATTAQAIRNELEAHAGDRDALDDYLNATAASYEETQPEELLRARRERHRMNRMHQVVDVAASRVHEANQRLPALFQNQTHAISDLETKLARAQEAENSLKHDYNKEIRQLKHNNGEAKKNVTSLEKENRRLHERVKNLIRLSEDNRAPFVPPIEKKERQQEADVLRKYEASIDHLKELLRQERGKSMELEKAAKKHKELEDLLQTTLNKERNTP